MPAEGSGHAGHLRRLGALERTQDGRELRTRPVLGGEPVSPVLATPTHRGVGHRTRRRAERRGTEHHSDYPPLLLHSLRHRHDHRRGHDDREKPDRLTPFDQGEPESDHDVRRPPPRQGQPHRDQREASFPGGVMT